ncbi:MAG TPA: hypothetical protein VFA65_05930 [Bryobacteraceae bacterium]|nr:hypothetical protein [Bryobacteraceae bacterium]
MTFRQADLLSARGYEQIILGRSTHSATYSIRSKTKARSSGSNPPVYGSPATWHWHPVMNGLLGSMFNYNRLGGSLFEEFGWHGFLQPRLQQVMPPLGRSHLSAFG